LSSPSELNAKSDVRFDESAMQALQEAAEAYTTGLFEGQSDRASSFARL
jgi:histone H3/H4